MNTSKIHYLKFVCGRQKDRETAEKQYRTKVGLCFAHLDSVEVQRPTGHIAESFAFATLIIPRNRKIPGRNNIQFGLRRVEPLSVRGSVTIPYPLGHV
jgi:hypothetical protein